MKSSARDTTYEACRSLGVGAGNKCEKAAAIQVFVLSVNVGKEMRALQGEATDDIYKAVDGSGC